MLQLIDTLEANGVVPEMETYFRKQMLWRILDEQTSHTKFNTKYNL